MLKESKSDTEASELAKIIDRDGDGKVSVDELIAFAKELELKAKHENDS